MRCNRMWRLSVTWMLVGGFAIVLSAAIHAQKTADGDKTAELVRVLQDPRATAEAKGKACEQLMDLGAAAAPAVPALIEQLKAKEEILRDYAITTLSKIGGGAAAALPALRQVAQSDPASEIRQLAERAIEEISAAAGAAPARGARETGGATPPPTPPVKPPVQPPSTPAPPPPVKPPVRPTDAKSSPGLQFGQYTLPDPYLQCTAWTFVAPMNWRREGGVSWSGRLTNGPAYSTSLNIRNPEGTQEFTLHPAFSFVETGYAPQAGGIEIQRVMDPVACIRQIILPRCRPEAGNVQVIASEPLPKMAEQTTAEARDAGLSGSAFQVKSGRMLVEYTVRGTRMEEMIYCTVAAFPALGGAVSWGVDRAFSYRAEKGKLRDAMAVLGTIAASLKENPKWVQSRRQKLAELVASGSQPPVIAVNSRGPSIVDVSKQMSRDQDEFLRNVDASIAARDRAAQVYSSVPRNTQMTQDPALGEQIEVGNGYLHYYRDYYGKVYGSDLNATDFYTQYHMNTTELQKK